MKTLGDYIIERVDSSNIDKIFNIYSSNKEYFILSGGKLATIDDIHKDMRERPPTTNINQKHYKAIKLEDQYIGVIDYITEYPDFDSIYVGLFIIEKRLQGYRHGYKIMESFEAEAEKKGYKRIRLGVLVNNETGIKFWTNKGFKVIKVMNSTIHPERNWKIKVMEKMI